jgi:septum site-determining protein MinC
MAAVTKTKASPTHKPIRLKGRSFIAFVLSPDWPLAGWLETLDKWTENSAGFFVGKPVVLDLANLDLAARDVEDIIAALGERNIRILGVEGIDESKVGPSLPPLLKGGRNAKVSEAPEPTPQPANPSGTPQEPHALMLEAPIRSGQSVIFPYGDVTVLGSVASGAEVAAGGSIHVYGTLRGRALAGSIGNTRARIFCRSNEAELLAIDGYYLTAEDMDASLRRRPIQAWLEDGVVKIAALD